MVTRRQFLKASALAAAGLTVRWKLGPWPSVRSWW
ncbi:MAG: twin-arginine translocation signal domain-containing protein [Anaerolineae bacterium]|nr:twin-arginine translocation signal domain-containing protein [Anaerolineae bacterium]NIN94218.1 twin-arginine translocation signal domain-containing protein [Anaerolineae bacterium]NIQ77270.1 twin-arginine translocation signal domain-containing protein [Anaerolineae bacterium]